MGRFQFALRPSLARWVATCTFVTVAVPGVVLVGNAIEGTTDWPWALKLAGVALLIFGLPTWWVFFRFIRCRVEIYDLGLRVRRLGKRELLWDDAVAFSKEVAEIRIAGAGALRCRIMSRNGDHFVFDAGMIGFDGLCALIERELGRRGIDPQTHVVRPGSL
jgi:hypothetical protein